MSPEHDAVDDSANASEDRADPSEDRPSATDVRRGPSDVVRTGYDRASYAYRSDDASDELPPLVPDLITRLPSGASVVDLGCGAGIPVTRALARSFDVIGVDISPVQIARARDLVPNVRFIRADMTEVELPDAAVDGVVALYSLIHVPLEEQRPLLSRIAAWLRRPGLLLVTVGTTAWTGTEHDWLGSGATMWWSHADEATYLRWLDELGFAVLERRFVPEGTSGHVFVLAELAG